MRVTVTCADVLDPSLGLAAHGPVDHVIGDPPYSAKVHARTRTLRAGAGGAGARQELGFESLTPEVRRRTAEAIAWVVRRWVVLFSDMEGVGAWCADLADAGLEPVQVGIWQKTNAMPQLTGTRPASPGEAIVVAHATNDGRPMKKRWNGRGRPLLYRGTAPRPKTRRRHPTEKPLWLMESIMREFTDPGDCVADPFAGAGTTLVSCARLGRSAVGWEHDPTWAALAEQRVAQTRPQLDLLDRAHASASTEQLKLEVS